MNFRKLDVHKREKFFTANKVIFLYPEIATASSFSLANKHLGASYIRAYLKEKNLTTYQFTSKRNLNLYELIEKLIEKDPAVLCISVYDCTYYTVKMIVKELKARKPEILIILGGPTATFSDSLIMEDFTESDICVRGEGEYTLYDILNAVYLGEDYSKILGITFRSKKNGKVYKNPDRDLIRGDQKANEMDVLPSPYLSGILSPDEGYHTGIVTARGCIFKCVYCNFSAMSRWTVRYHSAERVLEELRYIAKHRPEDKHMSITIHDDAFTLHKKRAKEICRQIIDCNFSLQFDCETRADTVDRELLKLMQKSGFRYLHFGIESGSPKVLKEIKKTSSAPTDVKGFKAERHFLQKIKTGVRTALALDLKPTVSIILGLPGESRQEGLESVEFIASLNKCPYYHNYLEIFAGTELFDTYKRYEIGLKKVYRHAVNRLYKTIYAYDVYSVPEITERSLVNTKLQASEMAALLCGDTFLFTPSATGPHPSMVIFTNATFANTASMNWYLENAGSGTRVAMVWQMEDQPGGFKSSQLYEMHMPFQMFYWLKDRYPDADETTFFEKAFDHNSENFTPYSFCFRDINEYENREIIARQTAGDSQCIFQI